MEIMSQSYQKAPPFLDYQGPATLKSIALETEPFAFKATLISTVDSSKS